MMDKMCIIGEKHKSGRHLSSSWPVLSSAQNPEELEAVDTNLIREFRHNKGVKEQTLGTFRSHFKEVCD